MSGSCTAGLGREPGGGTGVGDDEPRAESCCPERARGEIRAAHAEGLLLFRKLQEDAAVGRGSGGPVGDEAGEVPEGPSGYIHRNGGRSRRDGVEVDLALVRPTRAEDRVRVHGVRPLRARTDLATRRDARPVEVELEPGTRHAGAGGQLIEWDRIAPRHTLSSTPPTGSRTVLSRKQRS